MAKTQKEIKEELDEKVNSLIKGAIEKRLFEKAYYLTSSIYTVMDYEQHIEGKHDRSSGDYYINNTLYVRSFSGYSPIVIQIINGHDVVFAAKQTAIGPEKRTEIEAYKPSKFVKELETEYKRVRKIVDDQPIWKKIKEDQLKDQEFKKQIEQVKGKFEV